MTDKGLTDGWRFDVVWWKSRQHQATAESEYHYLSHYPRDTKSEAQADLELLKRMVEAMELARRGAPGVEEVMNELSSWLHGEFDGRTEKEEAIEKIVKNMLARFDAAKGE